MVKCSSKPKQISARQLRNLVREEKRAKALRPSARLPPTPKKKRVHTRTCQYDVSLARKKRAKVKPRLVTVRKARTESSLAFSAITEEIPLFDIVKRASNLVYMPQVPVPLVYPITPAAGKPTASISDASESLPITSPKLVSDDVPPNILNEEVKHLATPRPTLQVRSFSPSDLGIRNQVGVSGLDTMHIPAHVPNIVLRTATVKDPPSCPPSPSVSPLQGGRHLEDLMPAQVLSQLPIKQEPEPARVLLPKRLSLPLGSKNVLMDSPETNYDRSLMSSIWAQPAVLHPVGKRQDLRDALHVHHPNSNIDIKSEPLSVQECSRPIVEIGQHHIPSEDLVGNTQTTNTLSNDSLTQGGPDTARVPQLTMPEFTEPDTHVGNTRGDFTSNRKGFVVHKNRHGSGAFANAILRQTGHLREKAVALESLPSDVHLSHPMAYESPVRGSASKMKKNVQDGLGIQQTLEKPTLLNTLRFQSTRNEGLQCSAPIAPRCQTRLDLPTLSKLPGLASAAIIREDPFRQPSVRPTRKRLISVGRIITYNTTKSDEAQDCKRQTFNDTSRLDTSSVQETTQVLPEDAWRPSKQSANLVMPCTRSKRHWAKRVVANDISHRVSMENLASPSTGAYVAPDLNICEAQFANPARSGGSIKQRITTTLRAVYNRLWA